MNTRFFRINNHFFGFKRQLLTIIPLMVFLLLSIQTFGQADTAKTKAQKDKKPPKIVPLFDSDEVLKVTMKFDMTQFIRMKENAGSMDGVLMLHFNDKDTIDKNIKLKHRGFYRLHECNFPPIMVNFKKPLYVYSDSGKIDKMKLVTHCQTSPLYDEYVLREYLVYKLYNVITDSSFKVRLLRVTYLDSGNKKKPVNQYGIFIEPLNIMALRTNSAIVKSKQLNQKYMKPEVMARLAVFFYMVAQWDWAVETQHNIVIVKPLKFDPSGLGIPVPYDFDLTGIVNAEYAAITPELGLANSNIRERIFRGICQSREMYNGVLKEFMSKKSALYAVVNDFPYLNPRSKKDITQYLDTFFDRLNKQRDIDLLIDNFLSTCQKL